MTPSDIAWRGSAGSCLLLALPMLVLQLVALAAIADVSPPSPTAELQNTSFVDADGATGRPLLWGQQGSPYGTARRVARKGSSGGFALEIAPSQQGSMGAKAFAVYQMLDVTHYRGREVVFGARVATQGAGLNIVLWSPEGSQNDFDSNVNRPSWHERSGRFRVPEGASMLNLAIQVLGPGGGKAWVDEVYVRLEGAKSQGDPGAGSAAGAAAGASLDAPTLLGTVRSPSGQARVRVVASERTRELPKHFFGQHIEWVDDANGIVEPGTNRLRAPVVDLLRKIRVPIFRFPGGIHADFYSWKAGLGPLSGRGSALDPFAPGGPSAGARKKILFGSAEFLELLRATDAEACITANYGTGTAAEAGEWARWFVEQGAPPPCWEVGNEIYLSGPNSTGANSREIFKPGDRYARDYPAYSRAIKSAIPNARVGALLHFDTGAFALADKENLNWSNSMLDRLGADGTTVDYFALHPAYAPVIIDNTFDLSRQAVRASIYRSMFAAALQTEQNLERAAAEISTRSPKNSAAPFAITEFGTLLGISSSSDISRAYVDHTRTLASGLYVASVINVFMQNPRVEMTLYTNPIHRWYGNLITDLPEGLILTPTYHLYSFYADRFERQLVKTEVASPVFSSQRVGLIKAYREVPSLVGQASTSPDSRRLTLLLINRQLEGTLATELVLEGFSPKKVECRILAADHLNSINGPALSPTVQSGGRAIRPETFDCGQGSSIQLKLPAGTILSLVATR